GRDPLFAHRRLDALSRAQSLRHAHADKSFFTFPVRLYWRSRFSISRLNYRRGGEFFPGSQRPHPDRLHADAVVERRDFSTPVHAELAANRNPIHSGELFGDRYVRNLATRRDSLAKFQIGFRACGYVVG